MMYEDGSREEQWLEVVESDEGGWHTVEGPFQFEPRAREVLAAKRAEHPDRTYELVSVVKGVQFGRVIRFERELVGC